MKMLIAAVVLVVGVTTFLYALLMPTGVCVTTYEGGVATDERCETDEAAATVADLGFVVGAVATLGGIGGIYRFSGGVHWAVEFLVAGLLLLFGGLMMYVFAAVLWSVFASPEAWRSGPDLVAWIAMLLSLAVSGVIVLLGGWRGWSGLQQLR